MDAYPSRWPASCATALTWSASVSVKYGEKDLFFLGTGTGVRRPRVEAVQVPTADAHRAIGVRADIRVLVAAAGMGDSGQYQCQVPPV